MPMQDIRVRVTRPGPFIHLSHEADCMLAAAGREAKSLRKSLARAAIGALIEARKPVVHCLGFTWRSRCWAVSSRISKRGILVVEVAMAARLLPLIVRTPQEIRKRSISRPIPTARRGRIGSS